MNEMNAPQSCARQGSPNVYNSGARAQTRMDAGDRYRPKTHAEPARVKVVVASVTQPSAEYDERGQSC